MHCHRHRCYKMGSIWMWQLVEYDWSLQTFYWADLKSCSVFFYSEGKCCKSPSEITDIQNFSLFVKAFTELIICDRVFISPCSSRFNSLSLDVMSFENARSASHCGSSCKKKTWFRELAVEIFHWYPLKHSEWYVMVQVHCRLHLNRGKQTELSSLKPCFPLNVSEIWR